KRRNLRLRIALWITEFSDDFNNSALTTLSRHARRRKKIDPLLLIQRADHNLELWISEHSGQSKDSWRNASHLPKAWHQKRIESIRANCKIAAAVSVCNRILADGHNVGIRCRADVFCEREIRRIHLCAVPRGSAGPEHLPVQTKRTKQPIETKFFKIILVDLDKLRL